MEEVFEAAEKEKERQAEERIRKLQEERRKEQERMRDVKIDIKKSCSGKKN